MELTNINVLFLSSDLDSCSDLLMLLREHNVRVTTCEGVRGKRKLKNFECDLLMVDIKNSDPGFVSDLIDHCDHALHEIPMIYVAQPEESAQLFPLLQKYPGSAITRPFDRDHIFTLLQRTLKNINLYRQIKEEHQYYDALMKTAIVSKTDPNGIITFANENFCKLSGYTESELLGQSHNIVRHPDSSDAIFKEMWDTILQKKMWNGRVKNRNKDGGYYIVNATIFPLLDETGEIKEFMAIRTDITEIEEMQAKLQQEREHEKEIRHQQELLEEINRAKDEFLIVFTHELKTPLNAIINFSEYIEKQIQKSSIEKKEKLIELLESVRKNAVNMLENIINIIDLSKLKAGKLSLNITQVNVGDVVEDIKVRFAPIVHQLGAQVVYSVESCYVRSDERRLIQVISNIYSNALKYGNGKVLFQAGCEEGQLVVVIEDDGPGIKEAAKIFELYEQGDENKVSRSSQGTGAGLHFVKYLCQELHIDIAVEQSAALGGAKFILRGQKHETDRHTHR